MTGVISVKELESFSYRYPDVNDPAHQSKITAKKEFFDLGLTDKILPVPPKGEYYPHQELIRRYMCIYDFLIVDWQPGMGKTGAAFAVGETFRNSKELSNITAYRLGVPNWITHMWFLVPGPTIMKKHIQSFPIYSKLNTIPQGPTDFYTIQTYTTFFKEFSMFSTEELIHKFSGSIFVIDEAHEVINRSKEKKEESGRYNFLKTIFENAKRIKLMLLSGTTIIDKTVEFADLLNLGVNKFKDLPSGKSGQKFIKTASIEELAPYMRGRISYLRNITRKAKLIYPEESKGLLEYKDEIQKLPWKDKYIKIAQNIEEVSGSDIRIVPLKMMSPQNKIYKKSFQTKENKVWANSRNTSLFGIEQKPSIHLLNRLSNISLLQNTAIKIHKLVDIIDNSEGVVVIFTSLVEFGTTPISKLLPHYGYTQFDLTIPKGRVPAGGHIITLNPIKLGENPRFAVLTSANSKHNSIILDIEQSKENAHGELIKIIISSPVGELGLDIYHAQTFINLDPDWTISTQDQRLGRILRPESYDILYKERYRAAIQSGSTDAVARETAVVPVKLWYLVAFPSKDIISIDLYIYVRSLIKDIPLERLRLIRNRLSFDSHINLIHNKSYPCGIGETNEREAALCKYVPFNKRLKRDDLFTYNLLYGEKETLPIILTLADVITTEFSINIHTFISKYAPQSNPILIYRHILDISKLFKYIVNTLGKAVYINFSGDTIYGESKKDSYLPDTSIYTKLHNVLYENWEVLIKQKDPGFGTIKNAMDWLSNREVALDEKIEYIELVLLNSEHDYHRDIINRFLNKTVFLISFSQNILVDTETDDTKWIHVFHAQKSIGKGAKYGIYTDHIQAKVLAIEKDNYFTLLTPEYGRYEAYRNIISTHIIAEYERFKSSLDSKYNLVHGIVYDPENKPPRIVVTKKTTKQRHDGKIYETTQPRGKECSSYNKIELVHISIYLDIVPPSDVEDNLEAHTMEYINIDIQSEKKKNIPKLMDEYTEFYSDKKLGDYRKRLLYEWYINTDVSSNFLCKNIITQLDKLKHIYTF